MSRWKPRFSAAEDYDAMGTYDAGKEDVENTIAEIEMEHPTMTCDKDSVTYLTYQSGSSNKFHCFVLAQDKSGNWFAFNGAARIGYSPRLHRIYGPASVEQCRRAMSKKITTKKRKGYTDYFGTQKWYATAETYGAETFDAHDSQVCSECKIYGYWDDNPICPMCRFDTPADAIAWLESREAEMQYMELPVIPDSYGTDSATEMGGRGVPVWYGSAEGMEMTPDIMDYPGLPVVPDSYGTNSALESGQGVPVWYGSAENRQPPWSPTNPMPNRRIECGECHAKGFIAGKECTTCDGAGYWDIASPRCATCDTDIQWTDGAECDECDEWYCGNHLTEDGGCKVCGNTSLSFHAETFEARGGEMAHMTPDLLWENIGGFWKAVGINPDYDMGGQAGNGETGGNAGAAGGEGSGSGSGEEAQAGNGNEGGNGESQQEEEQQQPHDQRPPNQDGGNPDSVSAAETEMGLPVIPDSYGTDSATEMGGRGVPVWYGSAEDANPSGGSTGNQVVSWESGGLSSPSGPPSDIFWAEDDDGKFLCDSCGKLADFNFQDIDVRWDIDDGEFTGNYELRQHLGDYNDFLCLTCAEREGYAAEGGRGNWSEADAAHSLLRRKAKKQRTIDRKRSRRQKYSAEEERIRNAGELVDYVDVVMNGIVPIEKPFTLPTYLDELISQDMSDIMTSQDEMDILFRDGSMASCIYDARHNTLNTFVVAYGGDDDYNSETFDERDWDKTEYEHKDFEIVKPFGTAMKATMGVAAGTAAVIAITIGLLKIR